MAIRVPDTNTFSLQDVRNAIEDHAGDITDTLSDCFANAMSNYFDLNYEGSKDRLSNFRNYGSVPETITLYGPSGTTNHYTADALPQALNMQAWYNAVYDPAGLDVIYGTDTNMGAAGHHNDWITPPTTRIFRSFLEFDTSFLGSGASIISAKLKLYAAVHVHYLNPSIAPLKVYISSSDMLPISNTEQFIYFYSWRDIANMGNCGYFNCDSYSYKYYEINLNTDLISKTRSTWLVPRLNYWDYGYVMDNGVPSELMAVKFYVNKTGTYAPTLALEYEK